MVSISERSRQVEQRNTMRRNILSIMEDEIVSRGRELGRNGVLGKLMEEFFRYVGKYGEEQEKRVVLGIAEKLHQQGTVEDEIKRTMSVDTSTICP